MDGAMGKDNDVVEAVLTCEGDFHDPQLSTRIETFKERLKDLLLTGKEPKFCCLSNKFSLFAVRGVGPPFKKSSLSGRCLIFLQL